MNITQEQKEILLQWMKLHPEVSRNRLCRKGKNKKEMTWKDWKMYILRKETKRKSYNLQTDFLTAEAAGLEDIPQGGIYLNENINFSSQKSNNIMEGESSYLQQNENIAPNTMKRLHSGISPHTTNFKKTKLQSATDKMIMLEEKKITLKREKLGIQCELLEIQRLMLDE